MIAQQTDGFLSVSLDGILPFQRSLLNSMARLPLVLIPLYFVPLFIMLDVVALYQSRRVRAAPLRQ